MENHGQIVAVDRRGFVLAEDLLRPLSVRDGCRVFVLYYPCPDDEYHTDVIERSLPDFMITPHPPSLWPYLARFSVRLVNSPGAMGRVSTLLAARGVNILMAEAVRSGHRYGTWTFIAAFEDLYASDRDVERELENGATPEDIVQSLAERVQDRIRETRELLLGECRDKIFQDQDVPGAMDVRGCEVEALRYFYKRMLLNRGEGSSSSAPAVGVLRAHCSGRRVDFESKTEFAELLNRWDLQNTIPSRCVASMDVEEQNIRVGVLKRDRLSSYFKLLIPYERKTRIPADVSSSRGVISAVTTSLAGKGCNLWLVRNQTRRNRTGEEEGSLGFYLEDSLGGGKMAVVDAVAEAQGVVGSGIKLLDPHVTPMGCHRIFLSLKIESGIHEHIISLCEEVGRELGLLKEDFVYVKDTSSDSVTQKIIDELPTCDGMLQFFMSDRTQDRLDWLTAEALACSVLTKPYVLVVDPRFKQRIRVHRDKGVHELDAGFLKSKTETEAEEAERVVRDALSELVTEIERGGGLTSGDGTQSYGSRGLGAAES